MGALAGVVMMFFAGMVAFSFTGLGKAFARRIGGGPGDEALREEVAELAREVAHLRQQLEETQERLDFTERVVAKSRDQGRLPGGA